MKRFDRFFFWSIAERASGGLRASAMLLLSAACHEGALRTLEPAQAQPADAGSLSDTVAGELCAFDGSAQGQRQSAGLQADGSISEPSDACPTAPCDVHFIPAPTRRDMVYDSMRKLVYITAAATVEAPSAVLRWDVENRRSLSPVLSGGEYMGIDLAPDRELLAVADAQHDATAGRVHLINLENCGTRDQILPLAPGEGGTFVPLFVGNSTLLITSRSDGAELVPLWQVTDEGAAKLDDIEPDAALAASADGTMIVVRSFDGQRSSWWPLSPAAGERRDQEFGAMYDLCVSRDGTQVAALFRREITLQAAPFESRGGFWPSMSTPVGCAFSPVVTDLLYVAWRNDASGLARLVAEDTANDDVVEVSKVGGQIDLSDALEGGPWASGRLRISPDGSVLLAAVRGGVNLYRLDARGRTVMTSRDRGP